MSEAVALTGLDTLVVFAITSFIAAIVVTGAWIIQSLFLRCKASKILDGASRGSLTLALMFKSNHVTKLIPCRVHANGYLETLSKNKKDPKHYIPILRTTFTSSLVDAQVENDNSVKEADEIGQVEKQVLTPTAVEGTNCRAYMVYDGVACAVTPEALVALGVDSQRVKMAVGHGENTLLLSVGLNINPQLVKKYLTKLYDQSTVDGYGQDMWQAGFNTAKRTGDGSAKLAMLLGIGLCIVGAAMLVAAAVV